MRVMMQAGEQMRMDAGSVLELRPLHRLSYGGAGEVKELAETIGEFGPGAV